LNAFLGDPAVKADMLTAIAGSTSYQNPELLLLKYGVQNREFDTVSASFGLPPDFARLAVRTMGPSGSGEAPLRWDDLSTFMNAIEPGTDLSKVAHHWVLWAWAAAPEPLCGWLKGSPVLAIGDAVAAMHRRIVQGEAVESSEWRAVRAKFPQYAPATVQDFAAAAIASTAWDFSKVPGAATDVLVAWRELYQAKLRVELAWTRDLDEAARLERVAEWDEVYATVGPQLDGESNEAFRDRKHQALRAHMEAQRVDPEFKLSELEKNSLQFSRKLFDQMNKLNKMAAEGLWDAVKMVQRDFAHDQK
jgi:hypothetical protein